ncbi:MAG: hypothetical protein ACOYB8_04690 [Eubacteriaceae bacterium]
MSTKKGKKRKKNGNHTQSRQKQSSRKGFSTSTVVMLLIILFPAGLMAMWLSKTWTLPVRIILTVLCACIAIWALYAYMTGMFA